MWKLLYYKLNIKKYKTYDENNEALRQLNIDGYIVTKVFGDFIKMNNYELTYFEYKNNKEIIQYKFLIQNMIII